MKYFKRQNKTTNHSARNLTSNFHTLLTSTTPPVGEGAQKPQVRPSSPSKSLWFKSYCTCYPHLRVHISTSLVVVDCFFLKGVLERNDEKKKEEDEGKRRK
uniref:(northern house mosquito) hypothetical protein n=1 Tax=Culex pipiens TaxID=7175 RepID=A0A8D8KN34_CULPI